VPLILGGIEFNHPQGLKGNSDADVILHSITNALCSVTGQNILGAKAAWESCPIPVLIFILF
jgi:2-C-methyl-D-erythritol 2,4-cyclodiphosphate synthase